MNETTRDFVAKLEAFSGGKLKYPEDLGTLIETAGEYKLEKTLAELSFTAKFLHRTHGIMTRIGVHGEGYAALATAFAGNTTKAREQIRSLLFNAPVAVQQHFESTYLLMTPEGIKNLLGLFHDLSWYKNWLIDHEGGRAASRRALPHK